jgi:hypothetical protein
VTRTVDLVIAGNNSGAVAMAVEAVRKGLRVLVVCRTSNRALERVRGEHRTTLQVMRGAEVVCVDGVGTPEAVLVRESRSGRLIGVNTSQLLWFREQ